MLILLIETLAGTCLGGQGPKRRRKKIKKKFDDNDKKEEKNMTKTPDTVQMVERCVELS